MSGEKEVTVLTARSFAKVAVDGSTHTVEQVIREAGQDPTSCTVRINGTLCDDLSVVLVGGETISAFATKTIASAGVKGQQHKS